MSKRGKCGKGKPFQKQSLTPAEEKKVEKYIANNKERWNYLFSLKNKWMKPQ